MLSVKVTGDDLYKSTYECNFERNSENYKKKKIYKQYPSYSKGEPGLASVKRLDKYVKAKRFIRPSTYKSYFPLCLGLGCFGNPPLLNQDKPIVKSPAPKETRINPDVLPQFQIPVEEKPLKQQSLDELFRTCTWITRNKRDAKFVGYSHKKYPIKESTWEENADMVRDRPQRYEGHIGDWQIAGWAWNRVQARKTYFEEKPDCTIKIDESQAKADNIDRRNRISFPRIPVKKDPFQMALQCRERQISSYAGYVPREPVESSFDQRLSDFYQPTTKRTYREYSSNVFGDEKKAKKNHFSKMTTTVYPFNAFRNIPNQEYSSSYAKRL